MLDEARRAETTAALDELARALDDLVTRHRHARCRTTSTRTMSALILAIDSTRAALTDRRHQLAHSGPARETRSPPLAALHAASHEA